MLSPGCMSAGGRPTRHVPGPSWPSGHPSYSSWHSPPRCCPGSWPIRQLSNSRSRRPYSPGRVSRASACRPSTGPRVCGASWWCRSWPCACGTTPSGAASYLVGWGVAGGNQVHPQEVGQYPGQYPAVYLVGLDPRVRHGLCPERVGRDDEISGVPHDQIGPVPDAGGFDNNLGVSGTLLRNSLMDRPLFFTLMLPRSLPHHP